MQTIFGDIDVPSHVKAYVDKLDRESARVGIRAEDAPAKVREIFNSAIRKDLIRSIEPQGRSPRELLASLDFVMDEVKALAWQEIDARRA